MEKKTKTCPYCGGEILEVAKKCKHCGHWLNDNQPKVEEAPKVETKLTASPTPVDKGKPYRDAMVFSAAFIGLVFIIIFILWLIS